MCGICVATGRHAPRLVELMSAALIHRGPDDEGMHHDPASGVALGARRLSVVDVAGGHQPLSDESGTVWAVLNGEIYNYPSLREHLQKAGHQFRTRTDTEVLVHAYETWGDQLVYALEGMFVFAVWDSRRRRLLIARDRFGEKPFFYCERDGLFLAASELTALVRTGVVSTEIDPESVDDLFVLGYVRNPRSMLRDVQQLPPAHTLVWDAERKSVDVTRYWTVPPMPRESDAPSIGDVLADAERILRASVRSRMVADVPLGILLSGGVDSALLAAYAAEASSAPVKTFTVDYDVGAVGEADPARRTAEMIGADHHEVLLSLAQIATRVPDVFAALDQPIADQALIASHAVCASARTEVTVAVGGEGSDEIFGGYPRYRWMDRGARLTASAPAPLLKVAAGVLRSAPGPRAIRNLARVVQPMGTAERNAVWVAPLRSPLRAALYGARLKAMTARSVMDDLHTEGTHRGATADALMRHDLEAWLPDNVLAKADRASMLASLELRTPYLHRELAELAAMVPASWHIRSGGKSLVRRLLHDALPGLPPRRKHAFVVPAAEWLRGPLAPLLRVPAA